MVADDYPRQLYVVLSLFRLGEKRTSKLTRDKVGKFGTLGKEMRYKYLKNLLEQNTIDNSSVEGSISRFSILPFRRTEKRRARVPAEVDSRGGLLWTVEGLA